MNGISKNPEGPDDPDETAGLPATADLDHPEGGSEERGPGLLGVGMIVGGISLLAIVFLVQILFSDQLGRLGTTVLGTIGPYAALALAFGGLYNVLRVWMKRVPAGIITIALLAVLIIVLLISRLGIPPFS